MNSKDRLYWEGIAKVSAELEAEELRKKPIPEEALRFFDQSHLLVKELKGSVFQGESTAVELYKKWKSISQKRQ